MSYFEQRELVGPVNLDQLELAAANFYDVMHHLGMEAMDVYTWMQDDLTTEAKRLFRPQRGYGVNPEVSVGCQRDHTIFDEPLIGESAQFVGIFSTTSVILAPLVEHAITGVELYDEGDFVPAIIFDTIDPHRLPDQYAEQFGGAGGSMYPKIAVPLYGLPLVISPLPLVA